MSKHLYIGPIVQTDDKGQLIICEHAEILVENGKIISVNSGLKSSLDLAECPVTTLSAQQFFIPGFVDCHIHAVQLPHLGVGYDKNLLDWLEMYTYPLERKYSDEQYAEKVFDAVVRRTLSNGTTTACYFASLYGKASLILAQKVSQHCQRAFVGKINMDCIRDDKYSESTAESVKNTKQFVKEVMQIGNLLVKPIITPRFALSCSMELMKELGKIANDLNLHIQTHVSENLLEIETCKELFKKDNCSTYTSVYEQAGLLTNRTILAHGVHLEDSELEILKRRGTSIIHCPSSNTCLKSGLCDVQRLKSHGITIGLGTDVAGGSSVSMLEAMRASIQVSAHLAMIKGDTYVPLNYIDVFHFATLAGSKSLAIDDHVGSLIPGKQFDALIIDMDISNGPVDNLCDFDLKEQLQRLIFCGDDRNIVGVYVAGHKVK